MSQPYVHQGNGNPYDQPPDNNPYQQNYYNGYSGDPGYNYPPPPPPPPPPYVGGGDGSGTGFYQPQYQPPVTVINVKSRNDFAFCKFCGT